MLLGIRGRVLWEETQNVRNPWAEEGAYTTAGGSTLTLKEPCANPPWIDHPQVSTWMSSQQPEVERTDPGSHMLSRETAKFWFSSQLCHSLT